MFFLCFPDNLFCRHHHAHINNIIVIAGHNHSDDILTNIMDVTFYCCQENSTCTLSAFCFFGFNIWLKDSDRLFHGSGSLNNLWQEHFTFTKQLPDGIHTVHQWAFDDIDSMRKAFQGFMQVFLQIVADTLNQRIGKSFFHRTSSSGFLLMAIYRTIIIRTISLTSFVCFFSNLGSQFYQSLCRILPTV